MRIITILGIAASLAACATPPGRIKAVENPGACTAEDKARLQALTAQQNKTANNDALGVFLIGLPLGSMSGGDAETEIALLKGRCER